MLDAVNTPGTGDFAVTVDEQSADLSSNSPVSVRGRTLALGLDSAVTADQDVKVSYTDPNDGVDDPNAIQDPAGNDAASLTDQTVTNASAVPDERAPGFLKRGNDRPMGSSIVLTFDEDLDSRNGAQDRRLQRSRCRANARQSFDSDRERQDRDPRTWHGDYDRQ